MSRYIDANKIDFSEIKDDFDRARAKVIIMGQPTADVVPRAEVEKIFEEIEEERERWEAIYSRDHFKDGGGAYGYIETDVDHTIYELKKKYIGDKRKEDGK